MINIKKCKRFNNCSVNVCPLDENADIRKNLSEENRCPYVVNRKSRKEKGIKTLIPQEIINFIPIRNLKMLNRRNQKRLDGQK